MVVYMGLVKRAALVGWWREGPAIDDQGGQTNEQHHLLEG